jgi:hypothetical protein
VAQVVGETQGQIIMRLRWRGFAGVLGSADWLVSVDGGVALASAKLRDGLLDADALAAHIEEQSGWRRGRGCPAQAGGEDLFFARDIPAAAPSVARPM